MRIVVATNSDVDDIYDVETLCFDDPWSKQSIYSDVVNSKISKYFVARDEDRNILGFCGMYSVLNESHITNMAVLPQYRKLGIGSMLILRMIKECQIAGSFGLTLEVRVSNIAAIKAYEKFGFVVEGIRKNYYQNNNEDALIMWLLFENSNNV